MPAASSHSAILLVAPEPADWVSPVATALRSIGPLEVVAPWALPRTLSRWAPGSAFVRHRVLTGAVRHGFPWFPAVEAARRFYARGRIDRQIASRLAMRSVVDRAVAIRLRLQTEGAPTTVVAPSLGARRSFAAARSYGATCVLLEDLPDLRELARTLDDWSHRFPQCPLLRNHRARHATLVDQQAERELADAIGVRGNYAWRRLVHRFTANLFGLPGEPLSRMTPARSAARVVLVAGPGIGRSGTTILRELADRLPQLSFAVNANGSVEPRDLLRHPRIQRASESQRRLDGVGAVVSLSGVECNPAELRSAVRMQVPVVGTLAATGQLASESVHVVRPLDIPATASALRRALTPSAKRPRRWSPPRSFSAVF